MADGIEIVGGISERGAVELKVELSLRDLFAAFALMAVVGLNLDEATHESDAAYAYHAADAMLKARTAPNDPEAEGKG